MLVLACRVDRRTRLAAKVVDALGRRFSVVVKIRGSVADQARAAVLFLQGHGQPTATLAGYVEDAPPLSASSATGLSSTPARTSRRW
jgi:hypothetical protein